MKTLRKVASSRKSPSPRGHGLLHPRRAGCRAAHRHALLGNLLRECKVTERLVKAAQNEIINIVTIFLGLCVGLKMGGTKENPHQWNHRRGPQLPQPQTLGILALGVVAFAAATAAGVLMAKLMNVFSKNKINPLIGSAGVSAVPMAARVSHDVGMKADPTNFLLMHAMGPNVAGVIGSALAAGYFLSLRGSINPSRPPRFPPPIPAHAAP
jgi:carboxybiotin decarboxylase